MQDVRHELLRQRANLVARYHDAVELADSELDGHDIEADGEDSEERWFTSVVSKFPARDSHELGEVIAALDRLHSGTYGVCSVCADTIDEDWLADHPCVTTCLDCKVTCRIPTLVVQLAM
jgi:DnaK suppressor protein